MNLLSIFYYVVAGLLALFSSLFVAHLIIGILAFVLPGIMLDKNGQALPPFFGWIFIFTGSLVILIGWSMAVCMIFVGRFLRRRKKYTFCMVAAIISCTFIPFGTILGAFTIVLLI